MSELKTLVLETAERYIAAGLQVVCVHSNRCTNPIKRGKAPTHFGWQKRALTWPELKAEIFRVWEREGGCNLGVVTGRTSQLICVDIDARAGGRSWYEAHKSELGNPVVENTSDNGLHLYYKYPTGFDGVIRSLTGSGRLFKGVDILADGGHQVVTWPSIHASGKMQYNFVNSLDLTDLAAEGEEPPMWLLEELTAPPPAAEGVVEEASEGPLEVDVEHARSYLRQAPPAVEGAGGDITTLKAALVCKDLGLSTQQVYDLMSQEYNPRCSPPWSTSELLQKVKNAFKYGKKRQGSMSAASMFTEVASSSEGEEAAGEYSKKHPVHCAKVFLARCGDEIDCYDGQFVYYSSEGNKWSLVSDAYMESMIYRDVQAATNGGEELLTMRAAHIGDIRKVVKFELNKNIGIPDIHWRDDPSRGTECISMENGILDVQTGELLPHTRNFFCFQSLPVAYIEGEKCPNFLNFLQVVWDGDEELIESLRLWMGYCLLSSANLQKFAVFKGASRGGKSTLVGVIEAMVGRDNAASTSLSLIGSDFGLENLIGRKLIIFQDADRAGQDRMGIATERIKSISSNDPVGINRKNQSVIFQRLNAKISFVCNKMPPFLNDENALTNRMIVFPFWNSFQGKEDFSLAEKLSREIPGILNWALVGARRLLRGERLFTAGRGNDALEEITQQLDSVQGFIAESIEVTNLDHNVVANNELWYAYKEWCKDSGRMPKNKQRFFMELGGHKLLMDNKLRTSSLRGFKGIRLRGVDGAGTFDDEPTPF